jgi:hypothetical protein
LWKPFPAREDSLKAVHPTASTLDYPAARLEAGLLSDGLGFFSSGMNVRGQAERFFEFLSRVVD